MRGSIIKMCLIVLISLFVASSLTISYAHSGRTDASGGHRDNKNKSGLGSYHYHCGGYPPHLHENGYCPYTSKGKTSQSNESEKIVETIKPSTPITKEQKEIDNEVIEQENKNDKAEAIMSNEEISFEENVNDVVEDENDESTSVIGTMLVLGGAGYAAYKKFNG